MATYKDKRTWVKHLGAPIFHMKIKEHVRKSDFRELLAWPERPMQVKSIVKE